MKVISFDVGIKNLAYCCISVIDGVRRMFEWDIINLLDDNVSCKTVKTDVLRMSIVNKLDKIIYPLMFVHKIDHVLIENQPVKMNPKMKQVMDTLYCWFLIRCVKDLGIVEHIHLICPSNKLRKYVESKGLDYKKTKKMSVEVVNKYINDNELKCLRKHLDKFSKKDDLCDCFLQCLFWISVQKHCHI